MNPMEQEAARRAARLQALRAPRKDASDRTVEHLQAVNQALTLRNYKQVVAKETRLGRVREARPPEDDGSSAPDERTAPQPDTIESAMAGIVETALAGRQDDIANGELDITAIAPKRANWDLKRDLQKRLDELKPRNESAVADIVRSRIQAAGDEADLAAVVEAHSRDAVE
ncbi:Coiled-coil domain-containing protein 12 [Coemansia spiralis]|nr:Coiled-coil domain-containing protein 12 [Coemansia spiralis]